MFAFYFLCIALLCLSEAFNYVDNVWDCERRVILGMFHAKGDRGTLPAARANPV